MKLVSISLIVSISLFGSCAARARADLIGWSYEGDAASWLQVPPEGVPAPAVISASGVPRAQAVGSQRVSFATILLAANSFGEFNFLPPNNVLSLPLRITDAASGASGTVTFDVGVSGTIYSSAGDTMPPDNHDFASYSLKYLVANPTPPPLMLGGNSYAVTFAGLDFGGFQDDNSDKPSIPGAASAEVMVTHTAPEPAGWALACAGLVCVALATAVRRLGRPRVA